MDTIVRLIRQIQSRYNADFDLCADGPSVRWAEFTLAEIVKAQQNQIAELEGRIAKLEQGAGQSTNKVDCRAIVSPRRGKGKDND